MPMAVVRICVAVYADQAYNFQPKADRVPSWNVSLWEGFGTRYAYVGTGMFGHGTLPRYSNRRLHTRRIQ